MINARRNPKKGGIARRAIMGGDEGGGPVKSEKKQKRAMSERVHKGVEMT